MLDKASPEKQRVLAQDPQPGIPLPGKEVPMTCGCENQQELRLNETEGSWSPRHSSERACTDLVGLSPSQLQHSVRNLIGTRDIQKGAEFAGIGARVGGASFSIQKCWQRPPFLFWALPHRDSRQGGHI